MITIVEHTPPISSALQAARAYLNAAAHDGIHSLSTEISWTPTFDHVVPRRELRKSIRERRGIDIGFDFGHEGFSAMLGLTLLTQLGTIMPPALTKHFTSLTRRCRRSIGYAYFTDTLKFAPDTDCTALAAAALYETGQMSGSELRAIADELLLAGVSRTDDLDKVTHVYWNSAESDNVLPRSRVADPVVCANVLYTLMLADTPAAHDVITATTRYVRKHIESGAYQTGTRYYPSPYAFLYACSRLCARSAMYAPSLGPHLRSALTLANGQRTGDALEAALYIIAEGNMRPRERLLVHKEALARLQRPDGSWPAAAFYRMGRVDVYFGSPLLTTLFAVRALLVGNHGGH